MAAAAATIVHPSCPCRRHHHRASFVSAATVHPSRPLAAASPVHLQLQRGMAGAARAAWHLPLPSAPSPAACWFITSLWLLYWGLAAIEIEMLACGKGCPVVAKTCEPARSSLSPGCHFALVLSFGVQHCSVLPGHPLPTSRQPRVLVSKSFAAMRESLQFILLLAVGALLKGLAFVCVCVCVCVNRVQLSLTWEHWGWTW
ncbi:uncharacterized protein LOC110437179 isoform X2 [Sorghum bicolor]|uniref:uncharacterized protein LOC110437179 isoform X2 n=1 Tax=Sorghum bicolor TaxID=4558 RepID=UPI00081AC548|nr:uncharacterized protein LOC110437179 isoform X2 [Sorghum bicolor]|eukprot:XP_021321196.1 uncharacterized protein LOC110437179 isoform X2 [Sorghum bicolor]